ncbi:MAG: type I pantothenate kinase [Legionellales bacterium]|jgi:type I pantothenate kinase|nr:type I pantothenate kinase [Legionellales bacterium]
MLVNDNYNLFLRSEWASFNTFDKCSFKLDFIESLFGFDEPISAAELEEIYLPLATLLVKHIKAKQQLDSSINNFTCSSGVKKPFIIGVAGSVAVGKSTTSRILDYILSNENLYNLQVALVPTDGFLLPNKILETKNIMNKKGFPESYDLSKLLSFLGAARQGVAALQVPIYSHHHYDIMADKFLKIDRPDVIILEGLNVLQIPQLKSSSSLRQNCVADFIDYGIYVDARGEVIESWYVKRFLAYMQKAASDPSAYMHSLKHLNESSAKDCAHKIWQEINLLNLRQNILPSKCRADMILFKEASHGVSKVYIR